MSASLLAFAERTGLVQKEKLTLVALSGGLDSICLCEALHEAGYRIAAAHFNHALRGEASDGDERFVLDFCAARGIPCRTERGDVAAFARQEKIGTEEAARALRYAFLERSASELGASVIATAHHANDNAETVLFHLSRGTGLSGAAGIAPRRGNIVRPFLCVTREELSAYAREKGLSYREDATNSDEAYTRNYIRAKILPELAAVNTAAVRHISESALRFRADDEYLSELARERLTTLLAENGEVSLAGKELLGAPAALRRRMLTALLQRLGVGEKDFTAEHYTALEALCRDGQTRRLALPRAVCAVWKEGRLRLFVQSEEEKETVALSLGERAKWGGFEITLQSAAPDGEETIALEESALTLPLTVGKWSAKDRMTPPGLPASRSLKRLFSERGIDADARERVPVIRSGEEIAAVCGIGADKAFLPEGKACYLIFSKT